jgi:tetratricopeptide (TPR) repeat protein
MRDADEEIREIKKEIIESRTLIIKTNNLTNALSSDVKSIARRQAGYERRLNWNGVTAYVLFVLIWGVGMKMAYDARSATVRGQRDRAAVREDRLRKDVAQYRDQLDQRMRAENRAADFYDLLRQHKCAESVDAWEEVQKERLSRVERESFRDAVDACRADLSLQAYEDGLERSRAERWAEAARYFQNALELKEDASHIPLVRLELANAYRHLGKEREAIVLLEPLLEEGVGRSAADDACWLLAETHIALGEYEDARNELRTLLRRFPASKWAIPARLRLMEIQYRR